MGRTRLVAAPRANNFPRERITPGGGGFKQPAPPSLSGREKKLFGKKAAITPPKRGAARSPKGKDSPLFEEAPSREALLKARSLFIEGRVFEPRFLTKGLCPPKICPAALFLAFAPQIF